jgi:DNA invertase Pin-like site-specific DNA recombinase
MKPPNGKIRAEHVTRKACVYVRQSSMIQVQTHQESTRRQYELQRRANKLGWQEEMISIVDEDLGQSASKIGEQRSGFQRLLTAMVKGEVGAILSVEVSRLARQDSEGYRLVEVAALMGVLLIDEQQVYDPRLGDDRLMLGLKVLLSSNEIRLMRQRMQKNKQRKAQRGELRLELPVGYVNGVREEILVNPNEEVQAAVRLVFERFRLGDNLSGIVRCFNQNGLRFPRHKTNWGGPLEWGKLTIQRVGHILRNPIYAGAYVYGRTAVKTVLGENGQVRCKTYELEREDWGALIWEAFEGYISRDEFEANQERLAQIAAVSGKGRRRNLRKDGTALLTGLVWCGKCGSRMYVQYCGKSGKQAAYYCNTAQVHYAAPQCQRLPGKKLDYLISERVLAALTPAQIELSLAAMQELERQQAVLAQQRQRRLEGARYAARLAQRRYEQVEPENRLVARSLEAQWEARLLEVDRLESEVKRLEQQHKANLTEDQRQSLLALSQDLPKLWHAPSTTWKQRKQLLELLIADVTLVRHDDQISVKIRWHTNQVEHFCFTTKTRTKATPQAVIDRIAELYQSHTDQQIAQILNREGYTSAWRQPFNDRMVGKIRRKNDLLRNSNWQRLTPPAVISRVKVLCNTHTDQKIAQILNQEGLKTAHGLSFNKPRVADIRRYHNIPKKKSVGNM